MTYITNRKSKFVNYINSRLAQRYWYCDRFTLKEFHFVQVMIIIANLQLVVAYEVSGTVGSLRSVDFAKIVIRSGDKTDNPSPRTQRLKKQMWF